MASQPPLRSLEDFSNEVGKLMMEKSDVKGALQLSAGLRKQFEEALKNNPGCMLPSFNHQLPTGHEKGLFLALDVGGSTFRIALIELLGAEVQGARIRIVDQTSSRITDAVKQLDGLVFFDWLAGKIEEMIRDSPHATVGSHYSVGLSWSFPIGQTSLRSGLIQGLGKGFVGANTLLGQCLGDTLQAACDKRQLKIRLDAIVNDSNATLLAKAYTDSHATFSLILGTGTNIAVQLPVRIFGAAKFGSRPASWHAVAKDVLVNTELSAFGRGYLPMTRWDEDLNARHERPNAEPFEYFVSGRYLGEIVRLIIVEAVECAGLFNGTLPASLRADYSLDTEILSRMAGEDDLATSKSIFGVYPDIQSISDSDMTFVKHIAQEVSNRAVSVVASGIYSLWCLREESYGKDDDVATTVACDGSVIQSYPGFRFACREMVAALLNASGKKGTVDLEMTFESSLVGAAIAAAVV